MDAAAVAEGAIDKKKSLALKILVPALILVVILGMYFLKNSPNEENVVADVTHPLKISSVNPEEIKGYGNAAAVLKILMGAAILLIGFYMFWLAF